MTYRQAEATEFPAVSDDTVYCSLRGVMVGVSECVNSCAAPEQRPVCWLGKQACGASLGEEIWMKCELPAGHEGQHDMPSL